MCPVSVAISLLAVDEAWSQNCATAKIRVLDVDARVDTVGDDTLTGRGVVDVGAVVDLAVGDASKVVAGILLLNELLSSDLLSDCQ